jgi:hypothetical protein
MKTQMSKSGFKARALEVFRHIERTGEPVIITDHGEPTLIIRKYSPAAGTALQRLRGSVLRYDAPFEPVAEDDWKVLE